MEFKHGNHYTEYAQHSPLYMISILIKHLNRIAGENADVYSDLQFAKCDTQITATS